MKAEEKSLNKKTEQKPIHAGHRKRMLERFETGSEYFKDHELLEILLYNAIPRANTNTIAHDLIYAFGSLAEVFRADIKQLTGVKGVGKRTAEYIKCLGLCFDKINPAPQKFPNYVTPKEFGDFLKEEYSGMQREAVELFFINKVGQLFFRRRFSTGDGSKAELNATELGELLSIQKPHTLVAAHNHPHASSLPSVQDDIFTKNLCFMCYMHNVLLGDHMIVGNDGVYSYRIAGKLDKYRAECKKSDFN